MTLERTDLLDNLFESFLQESRIFKNRDVLRHDFIPAYLPHRDEQTRMIGSILAPVLNGSRPSNIFIYGKTGTGKTAVVKFVLDKLVRKSRELHASIEVCYVNCRIAGTDYRVLSQLCESIGLHIPFTGLAVGEVFDRFKGALESKRILLITVLDEVDALIKAKGDAVLYELTRINENLKFGRVSILGISNNLRFKELLDPRVLSSLSEEEAVFRPYSAPELHDILQERSKLAFLDAALGAGVINLCSALAAAEHGDARRALDLLRVAGELAERHSEKLVTEEHVRQAQEKIEQDRVVEVLKTLPLHSKLVLFGVYLIKKTNSNGSITGDVFEVYKELCGQLGVEVLTQRRVSGLINELDIMGVLNARVVSFGRYGRTKKVSIGVSSSVIRNIFIDDSWVGRLLDYAPNCLKTKSN
ncbi:MAG TPA: ORC1-type DNA replication protein [archaeon]|nr:ORC1-type DNA replication protein [archaeon]